MTNPLVHQQLNKQNPVVLVVLTRLNLPVIYKDLQYASDVIIHVNSNNEIVNYLRANNWTLEEI